MRVKTRLQLSELEDYFPSSVADTIERKIWGKNTTMILQALNGKHYWVSFVCKSFSDGYLKTMIAKPSTTNPGCFTL